MKRDINISVFVATFNTPDYLELCLRSLLRQSVKPMEIIIADDGSGPETKALIDRLAATTDIPLVHVWHEDQGFRKIVIMNKAIAVARGDLFVMVDGDVICHRKMLSDHLSTIRPGVFLSGSRVALSPGLTRKVLDSKDIRIPLLAWTYFNRIRIPWLSGVVSRHFKQGKKYRYRSARGCNMSIWRDDVIAVNGYNESLPGRGGDDTDLGFRLNNYGIKMLNFKLAATVFHLYHTSDAPRVFENCDQACRNLDSGMIRCEKGLDQYL